MKAKLIKKTDEPVPQRMSARPVTRTPLMVTREWVKERQAAQPQNPRAVFAPLFAVSA